MMVEYPTHPLPILLFAPVALDYQQLRAALYGGHIAAEITVVESGLAFQQALTSEWAVILVTYPAVAAALAVLQQWAPERSITILYTASEEAQAFALTDALINDLLPLAQLQRLPLIIRREWTRQQSHPTARRLQQLESRFRAIVEGFGDAILLADGYGLVRYVNSAFGHNFGYGVGAVLGKPFVTFLQPSERPAFQARLAHLCQQGEVLEVFEHHLQRTDGTLAEVEITGHSMLDPAAQLFVVFHVRDVSARKQAEAALMESEERLRLFVEHAPAAIAMLDQEMRYLAVSQRWLADYRLGEQSILGRSHYELFPDLPAAWRTTHQQCLQGAVAKSEADPFPRADGTVDWVRWEIHPWRNRLGAIGGLLLFSEVITARKRAEAAEHEQRLLAETMRDSLAVLTSSREVDAVMEQILAASARVVPSEAGAILLANNNEWRVAYSRGHDPQAQAFFKATPLILDTQFHAQSGQGPDYYLAADTDQTPGWITFVHTAWIRSSIGVQIVLHGQPIGFLTADSATPNQYGAKDVANLQTFARYAALALENAYHVSQLEQRVQERTAALAAAKTQVEAILNNSPDGILLIDQDLTIQQANDALHQLFHCTPADCCEQSLLMLIHPDDHPRVVQLIQRVTTQALRQRVELRAQRKDGAIFDAELSVGLIQADGLVCILHDISERKGQERQLRYHASLQKTVSDAVIVTDMESRVQSWNPAAERMYGWSAAEATGRTMGELVHTQFTFPEERAYLLERLRGQGWWYGEFIQQRKDGMSCHILSSAALVNDEQGNPIGMIAVNHDITERKQAEDALQKSAAEIHDLYNNAPCGYHSLDPDGLIVQMNDTELAWLGYTRAEVIGRLKFADIITTASMQVFQTNFPLFKTRGWVNDLEFELVGKDGTIRPVLLSSTAVYDDDGHYQQSRSTLFDVTALHQAQQAIVESEARYRLLAENVIDVISKYDVAGCITFVTPSCYALTGYRPEELLGQPLSFYIHAEDLLQSTAEIREALSARERSYVLTNRIRHKAGHYFWAESIVTVIREPSNSASAEFIAITRDITKRKQTEAALRESEARYRLVAENVIDLISKYDATGHFTFVTPSCYALTGYRPEELLGQNRSHYIHPEDLPQSAAVVQAAFSAGAPSYTVTNRICHKAGHYLWVESSVTIVREPSSGAIAEFIAVTRDVTMRKQTADALRESEARYRLLAENAIDMVTRHNSQGDFVYVSPSTARVIGYQPDELVGRPGFTVIHPDQWAQMGEMMRQASQPQPQPLMQIFQVRHKAGYYILLEISMRAIFAETGEVIEFIGSAHDVTEQQLAEAALRASEEKFRQVAENFDHLLFIHSPDNETMLYINSAAERLTGIPRTQLFADSQSFLSHIHPDDLEFVQQQQSLSNLAEGRADLEYRFIRPDGRLRWFRFRSFPIRNEAGIIISRVGTLEDITERKQIELALQESEAKYRLLVETMRGGLVMFDANHKMVYVNDRFCELLARRRDELIGTSPFDHVDDANRALVIAQLERRRQLESSTYELAIQRPDGQQIYLLSQGSPLHDKAGNYNGGFAVVTDITAHKEAEATLRQALAKEKELGELKSRFVSIASHEFRTPLATISATTETLLTYRERLEPAQFNLRLNKILAQVGHMKEIMEDVLQLARIQAERVDFHGEEGDLSALCSDIIEEFRSRPGYQDRIISVPDQAPIRLYFDARLIRQVIGNLISNGLKYSTAEQPVLVTLHQEAEAVILQVTDHGIGIPNTDLKHIFEPFHRAQNVGTISGTGLGLSISKEAIKMHGGRIHIDTQLNLGTTVTVTLPINAQRGNAHVKDSDH